jgi:hypothetical protein
MKFIQLAQSLPFRCQRTIVRYNQVILSFTAAIYIVLINNLPTLACQGFGCDATDYMKNNSIVSSAGQAAVDLMTFPFFIVTTLILFVVVVVIAATMGAFAEGREGWSGLIKLACLFGVALFGAAMISFMVSGTFGGTPTSGTTP